MYFQKEKKNQNQNQNPRLKDNLKRNVPNRNKQPKPIKRIDDICHIPDCEQAFSYVKNGGFKLVLYM